MSSPKSEAVNVGIGRCAFCFLLTAWLLAGGATPAGRSSGCNPPFWQRHYRAHPRAPARHPASLDAIIISASSATTALGSASAVARHLPRPRPAGCRQRRPIDQTLASARSASMKLPSSSSARTTMPIMRVTRQTPAGQDAHTGVGVGKARVLAGIQIITGQSQLKPTCDCSTIYRTDNGLGALLQCDHNRRFSPRPSPLDSSSGSSVNAFRSTPAQMRGRTGQHNSSHGLIGCEVGKGRNDGLGQFSIERVMRVDDLVTSATPAS